MEDSESDIEKHIDVKEKETLTEKNEAKKEFEKEENEQEGDNISLESFEADKIIQEEMQLKKGPSLGLIEEDENGESDSDIKKTQEGKDPKEKVSVNPPKNKNKNQEKDKKREETLNKFIKESN